MSNSVSGADAVSGTRATHQPGGAFARPRPGTRRVNRLSSRPGFMSGPRRWKDKESDALCPGCALVLARYSTLSSCHVPLPLTGGERRGCVSGRVPRPTVTTQRVRRATVLVRLVGVTRSVPRYLVRRYARARRERFPVETEYLEYTLHRRAAPPVGVSAQTRFKNPGRKRIFLNFGPALARAPAMDCHANAIGRRVRVRMP